MMHSSDYFYRNIMIPLMNFNSLWGFKILEVISHYKAFLRYASVQVIKDQNTTDKAVNKKKKNKKFIIPPLTTEKLKVLKDITSIAVEMNHVSWAKMSILNFTLLEWDAFELPQNFRNDMNEFEVLNLGNFVQQKIPSSDLYVIENHNRYKLKFNELYLKIALMMQIGNFNKDSAMYQNIVFQHPMVLNVVFKLLIGRERRATKQVVENIFSLKEDVNSDNDSIYNTCSFIKISKEKIQNFETFGRTKQESLSLALLISLSFLHLNFFENQEDYFNRKILNSLRFN